MQQSQSPPPAVPAQPASQTIYKLDSGSHRPGNPDQIQPDLSHLTPEERRIIEDVINRQRQEELIDRDWAVDANSCDEYANPPNQLKR
ncbi:unnamed protein product [Hydatigera taeniaeformis]|uniref:Transcriptional regulator n=1 Tax=Hydatigena taeniaeformis TaxID=6205 RepID=A0A0R3XAA6_HYDTA|nr:unnamed protein product [Hydatigera taeniaeformis]